MRPDRMGRDELYSRLRYACGLLERMDSLERQIIQLRQGYKAAPTRKSCQAISNPCCARS